MKAYTYTEYGPPEVVTLQTVEKPVPADDQLLIRVKATAVTTGDVNIRGFSQMSAEFKPLARLMFGLTKPTNQQLGMVFAGEVVAVGKSVQEFSVGDKVYGMDSDGRAAHAEFKTIAEHKCVTKMPKKLTFEQAAAVPFGATTALHFLKLAKIGPDKKVLVLGASGNVGGTAVQLAKAYQAHVTGVSSSQNAKKVRALGADTVIDYTKQDVTKVQEKFDIIIDTVVKQTSFAKYQHLLRDNGYYVPIAGGLKEMLQSVVNKKCIAGTAEEKKEYLEEISRLIDNGVYTPNIAHIFDFKDMVEAHRWVDQGHKGGVVVVRV